MKYLINLLFVITCSIGILLVSNICLKADSYEKTIGYEFNKTLFTTFTFINLGKFYTDDTSNINHHALKLCRSVSERISDDTKKDIVKQYLTLKGEYDWMLEYVATMVAINSTYPPNINPETYKLEIFDKTHGTNNRWVINRLNSFESVYPILNKLWIEANIYNSIQSFNDLYDSIGKIYFNQAKNVINQSLRYLRLTEEEAFENKTIKILVNLIGPDGEMGPEFCNVIYDIKGCNSSYTYRPHELLHSIVAKKTKELSNKDRIEKLTAMIWDEVENTKARKSYPSMLIYFDECLVRALDYRITELNSIKDSYKIEKEIDNDVKNGFVFIKPICEILAGYERSDQSFYDFFNDLLTNLEDISS